MVQTSSCERLSTTSSQRIDLGALIVVLGSILKLPVPAARVVFEAARRVAKVKASIDIESGGSLELGRIDPLDSLRPNQLL